MTWPIKLALLISGGGTTMEQILVACYSGILKGLIEPTLVIASKDKIGGIQRAIDVGFPRDRILLCGRRRYESDHDFGLSLLSLLVTHHIDLVGQFGWLCKTPENVIERYENRIINQHPGPLDHGYLGFGGEGMYGRRVHCARLFFARTTGNPRDQYSEATTHIVTARYDDGPAIGRTVVPILLGDDVTSLQERILPEEHKLQIAVLKMIAESGGADKLRGLYERDERLVLPGQESLLSMSKLVAGMLFPKG